MTGSSKPGNSDTVDRPEDVVDWMSSQWEVQPGPDARQYGTAMALLRTHQQVVTVIDAVLRRLRLSRNAYLILTSLQMSEGRTHSMGKLAKYLMVHATTVSMTVDQLQKAGLVERGPHPTDRRTVLATLTIEGAELVDLANEQLAAVGFGLEAIGPEDLDIFAHGLAVARSAMGDDETGL